MIHNIDIYSEVLLEIQIKINVQVFVDNTGSRSQDANPVNLTGIKEINICFILNLHFDFGI